MRIGALADASDGINTSAIQVAACVPGSVDPISGDTMVCPGATIVAPPTCMPGDSLSIDTSGNYICVGPNGQTVNTANPSTMSLAGAPLGLLAVVGLIAAAMIFGGKR